jgi:hypothetical protein
MRHKNVPKHWSVFKTVVLTTFLIVSILLYIYFVQLYLGQWKKYFMRSGNFMYYVYAFLLSWVYVQIIKYLWKWQVRVLT